MEAETPTTSADDISGHLESNRVRIAEKSPCFPFDQAEKNCRHLNLSDQTAGNYDASDDSGEDDYSSELESHEDKEVLFYMMSVGANCEVNTTERSEVQKSSTETCKVGADDETRHQECSEDSICDNKENTEVLYPGEQREDNATELSFAPCDSEPENEGNEISANKNENDISLLQELDSNANIVQGKSDSPNIKAVQKTPSRVDPPASVTDLNTKVTALNAPTCDLVCEVCGFIAESREILSHHVRVHPRIDEKSGQIRRFFCTLCPSFFHDVTAVRKHIDLTHWHQINISQEQYPSVKSADNAGLGTNSANEGTTGEKSVGKTTTGIKSKVKGSIKCAHCPMSFSDNVTYDAHFHEHLISCLSKNKTTETGELNYYKRRKSNRRQGEFPCDVCKKTFKFKSTATHHKSFRHRFDELLPNKKTTQRRKASRFSGFRFSSLSDLPESSYRIIYNSEIPASVKAQSYAAKTGVNMNPISTSDITQRLQNNEPEKIPDCYCLGKKSYNESAEGPYYTHLGAAKDLSYLRHVMEKRTGASGSELRLQRIKYTGKEGKTLMGCPAAKWIIRRSGREEKVLCVVKQRPGHKCDTSVLVVCIVVWEGITTTHADHLYDFMCDVLPKYGLETERRCGFNSRRDCGCQGWDLQTGGASFSFGCSWSMYYNGCKFSRNPTCLPRKFRLREEAHEEDVENNLQSMATEVADLYSNVAPDSFNNMTQYEKEGLSCRLGHKPGRPFSGVTAVVDFCAHSHKDSHNMYNGCTAIITLTNPESRDVRCPSDEQLHVLPLYVPDATGTQRTSSQGQGPAALVDILEKYPVTMRIRPTPTLTSKKKRKLEKENGSLQTQEPEVDEEEDTGHAHSGLTEVRGAEYDTECKEIFTDDKIGGVAIALSHGSVMFECAKQELHATTALKEPSRENPKRISLVFYQHKNLNKTNHGYDEFVSRKCDA